MLYELGAIKACIVYLSTPAQLTPQLLILDTWATPRHVHCARQVGIFTAFAWFEFPTRFYSTSTVWHLIRFHAMILGFNFMTCTWCVLMQFYIIQGFHLRQVSYMQENVKYLWLAIMLVKLSAGWVFENWNLFSLYLFSYTISPFRVRTLKLKHSFLLSVFLFHHSIYVYRHSGRHIIHLMQHFLLFHHTNFDMKLL